MKNKKKHIFLVVLLSMVALIFFYVYKFTFGHYVLEDKTEFGEVILFGDSPDYFDLNYDGPYISYHKNYAEIIEINKKNKDNHHPFKINISVEDTIKLKDIVFNCITDSSEYSSKRNFTFKINKNICRLPSKINSKNSKILIISDIEGNFDKLYNILLSNRVIDKNYKWTFENNYLVLNGDFIDRGLNSIQVLWLIYELERQSKNVIFLLGNHEEMNCRGNSKYNSRKQDALNIILRSNSSYYFHENSEIGKWLRQKNSVQIIDDIMIMHGGFSPNLLKERLSLDTINLIISKNLGIKKHLIKGNIEKLVLGDSGPLWYRGYFEEHDEYSKAKQKDIDEICNYYAVNKIIVGHTIVDEIKTHYKGKVIGIDVSRHSDIKKNKPSGLLIENNKFFALDELGRKFPIK